MTSPNASDGDSVGTAERPASTGRMVSMVFGIAGVTVFLICWMTSFSHLEQLLLGWLYFPIRTIPRMTIDPPAVCAGLICLTLLAVTLYFGGLRVLRRNRSVNAQTHVWTLGNALTSVVLFLALFASGISFVGICHQVVWMWSGRNDQAEDVAASEMGIIGILTEQTDQMQAKFQLQSLSLAIQNYHDSHDELPPGGTMTEHGELLHGWLMLIGPYDTYIAPQLDEWISWRKPPNAEVYQCQSDRFLNPSMSGEVFDKDGFGLTHWAANCHVMPIRVVESKTVFSAKPVHKERGVTFDDISDGLKNTILLGTASQNLRPWGHPANVRDPALGINRSPDGFGGPPGWNGAMFAMCDGSVQLLSESTDPKVLKALGTPAGND
ncbi:MAG: DUF1559 domain-containing protein [Planctomyces sp.]|nr:DUF1559 domain-containing protein [Planctomyces sp.]